MNRWRIYYTGDRVFGSEDGSWADAPNEGVLLVAEDRAGVVTLHMGHDHYQLEDDGSIVMRDSRTILAHVGITQMSSIKFGLYTSSSQMERVIQRAQKEWLSVK